MTKLTVPFFFWFLILSASAARTARRGIVETSSGFLLLRITHLGPIAISVVLSVVLDLLDYVLMHINRVRNFLEIGWENICIFAWYGLSSNIDLL